MNNGTEVIAIVEGKTEQDFIRKVVAPYLQKKDVYITPIQVSKSGSKGGDVKFSRVKNDLHNHLTQRRDTRITTFLDLYGLKEWPGLEAVKNDPNYEHMIERLYASTDDALKEVFDPHTVEQRIIPFFAMYEFESLLFSEPEILAEKLACPCDSITEIIEECGEPERINNSPQTAPSKRLNALASRGNFKKTSEGVAIASAIGIDTMRDKCPQFDQWISRLEAIHEDES